MRDAEEITDIDTQDRHNKFVDHGSKLLSLYTGVCQSLG